MTSYPKHDLRALYANQAQALNAACKAGQLAEAYRVINRLSKQQRSDLMLVAGFSVTGTTDNKQLHYFQSQLADACKNRVDGRGLNLVRVPANFKPMAVAA